MVIHTGIKDVPGTDRAKPGQTEPERALPTRTAENRSIAGCAD